MDPFTHALLGAAVGQASCSKKLGRSALWIGLLGGITPDIDILIQSPHNPLLFILFHRNFTHSLLFIPIGGLLIGLLCLALFKQLRTNWPYVIIVAMLGYATHSILDTCTSYGTLLFWPFSNYRVAFDIISIVDPIFTAILLVGVIVSAKKIRAKPAIISLALIGLYLCFTTWQHHRGTEMQKTLANTRHQTIVKSRVMPTLANAFIWNSIYISNQKIYYDKIITPLFSKTYAVKGSHTPLANSSELPKSITSNQVLMHDFTVFKWFSDGFITTVSTKPLIIGDMRYIRQKGHATVLWGIKFPNNATQQHVEWMRDLRIYAK